MNKNKLASVIIPCYNAEHWLKEAIDSCLAQTYLLIEVIVINDGSTDGSAEIIESYGSRIISESGPNRGGNYARNRGFELSKGYYIQYLDADDYLKPEKIERQVLYLEKIDADGVYGDWQHQHHLPNGKVVLGGIEVSGEQTDLLRSLLSGWWVSPACLLFRRSTVEATEGWDETLTTGQDKDFFLSIVMGGADIRYQPGCYAVYRRYGNVTVSTLSKERHLVNHIKILEKYELRLADRNRLTPVYREAIAQSFFLIARKYFDSDEAKYKQYLIRALTLSPDFRANKVNRSQFYSLLEAAVGFRQTEKIVTLAKTTKKKLLANSRLLFRNFARLPVFSEIKIK